MAKPYPPEKKAAVLADYQAGITFDEMVEKHEISRATIDNWVKASGLPRRQKPKQDHSRVHNLPERKVALTGGEWVRDHRGVFVWKEGA